jgi:hypothetical protein
VFCRPGEGQAIPQACRTKHTMSEQSVSEVPLGNACAASCRGLELPPVKIGASLHATLWRLLNNCSSGREHWGAHQGTVDAYERGA